MQAARSLYCPHLRTDKGRENTGKRERYTNKAKPNHHAKGTAYYNNSRPSKTIWNNQMAIYEKDGITNCIFSTQKTYRAVNV